jgi:hypothetical protein
MGEMVRDRLELMNKCKARMKCRFGAADLRARYGYGYSFYFGGTAEGRAH